MRTFVNQAKAVYCINNKRVDIESNKLIAILKEKCRCICKCYTIHNFIYMKITLL